MPDGFELIGTWQGRAANQFGEYGVLESADGRRIGFRLTKLLAKRVDLVKVGEKLRIVKRGIQRLGNGQTLLLIDLFSATPVHTPSNGDDISDDDVPF